jgi:glutamate/tyrosine decarboxylase-like PLP-dependent enzyme
MRESLAGARILGFGVAMDDSMTLWEQVGREVDDFISGIRTLPVSSSPRPDTVRQAIESRFDFVEPIRLPDLTQQVADLLRQYAVHVTHPRYFGLFNPSVSTASIVADTLAALYNPQLAAWSHSPAANEIERVTLRYFAQALGFDADASSANFTTGGLEANLSAVVVALVHRFPAYERGGTGSLEAKPAIYVTNESHHSFVKICRIAGLGTDALREVPTTAQFTMDTQALRNIIDLDASSGRRPFLIVATAGTTGGGIVDPLPELADIAAASNVWFHVDAAWGGAAVLVPRLRPALRGIERADSITWDAHKWLSVPMGAGMFFCRHVDAVRRAFDVSTSYMPSTTGQETTDQYHTTLQWSRRAIGLKVFMSLAERGRAGLAEQIDHQARMGDALRTKLIAAGWIVVNDTMLPLVCTTHEDIRSGRCTTDDIVSSIQARGRAWISDVVLGRRERLLRACITSFRTNEEDLDVLVSELDRARTEHPRGET